MDVKRSKCVACGNETVRPGPVCHQCLDNVLVEADRQQIPLVGSRSEARRIGFTPPARS
jgi:hypothetical protein